ncbi:NADPH-dependent F420 reductase [Gluconobacter morbifer]|nr:NADPH-dependent F420 reductase [Gluconobacter morbifer]
MTSFPLRRRPFLAALAGLAAASGASGVQASDPSMKIGIIGAGHVGSTLAALWVRAGYHVMISSRSLAESQKLSTALGPLATAGTPGQAAAYGTVVVLAVPYKAIPQLGRDLSRTLLDKTILDPSNPYPFRDGVIADTAEKNGAGITTQRYFPSAHVVRAFNSIDMSTLEAEAHRTPPLLAVPVAGDDAASVSRVTDLVRAAGFDPVVTGGLETARLFQPGSAGFELERDAPDLKDALHLKD